MALKKRAQTKIGKYDVSGVRPVSPLESENKPIRESRIPQTKREGAATIGPPSPLGNKYGIEIEDKKNYGCTMQKSTFIDRITGNYVEISGQQGSSFHVRNHYAGYLGLRTKAQLKQVLYWV